MKTRFIHIIAFMFLSLFLAKGVTESFLQVRHFAGKIALQADASSNEQEREKNAGEKEIVLFFEKPETTIPRITDSSFKEKITAGPATWSNICLPVSTPPPEIA